MGTVSSEERGKQLNIDSGLLSTGPAEISI